MRVVSSSLASSFQQPGLYTVENLSGLTLTRAQAAGLLHGIMEQQLKVSRLFQTPAIVTDGDERVLALAVGDALLSKIGFESPTSVVLREVSRQKQVAELCDLGLTLHVVCNPESGCLPQMGDIYNCAPSSVSFSNWRTAADLGSEFTSPANPFFQQHALEKRKIKLLDPVTQFEAIKRAIKAAPTSAPWLQVPQHFEPVELLRKKWDDVVFPVDTPRRLRVSIQELMLEMHQTATKNVVSGGGPFLAVIIGMRDRFKGRIVGIGANQVFGKKDPTGHAERHAKCDVVTRLGPEALQDAILVSTADLCIGCQGATAASGIKRIFAGVDKGRVERLSKCFTEGPARSDFLVRQGLVVEDRIECPKVAEAEPFKMFQRDPSRRYLVDHSKK